jgi:hypothetical protein
MLGKIAAVAAQLVEAAGSVVGVRAGTQEPRFDIEKRVNGMEIRRYEARIAAQTTVTGVEASARSQGFRRLAGYIFGGNHKKSKIAMTAPVSQERGTTTSGERIAMTAPVSQEAGHDGSWVIRFFMPAKWTLDTLPEPNDTSVQLGHRAGRDFRRAALHRRLRAWCDRLTYRTIAALAARHPIRAIRRPAGMVLRPAVDAAVPPPQRGRRAGNQALTTNTPGRWNRKVCAMAGLGIGLRREGPGSDERGSFGTVRHYLGDTAYPSRPPASAYQPIDPGIPLKGPTIQLVTQPP